MKTPSCAASTATPRSPQHPARTARAQDRTSQPLTAPVRSARILMPPWRPSVDRSRTKLQPSPTPASQAVLPKTHEQSAEITAIIAVLTATGIRLPELTYLRCSRRLVAAGDTVHDKSGKDRIDHQAARSLDRYIRARSRHPHAWRRSCGGEPATGSR
jgi:hypothetical protein